MKTLRKYITIVLLLISATNIVPTYANLGDDLKDNYLGFKEKMIQQSKKPEMLKMTFKACETICLAAQITVLTTVVTIWATGFVMLCINPKAVTGRWIPIIKYEYLHAKLTQLKNYANLT